MNRLIASDSKLHTTIFIACILDNLNTQIRAFNSGQISAVHVEHIRGSSLDLRLDNGGPQLLGLDGLGSRSYNCSKSSPHTPKIHGRSLDTLATSLRLTHVHVPWLQIDCARGFVNFFAIELILTTE